VAAATAQRGVKAAHLVSGPPLAQENIDHPI